jgi:hypothetical protein
VAAHYGSTVFDLKLALEDRIRRAEEIAGAFADFKRQVALAARFGRSGRMLGEGALQQLEERGAPAGASRGRPRCLRGGLWLCVRRSCSEAPRAPRRQGRLQLLKVRLRCFAASAPCRARRGRGAAPRAAEERAPGQQVGPEPGLSQGQQGSVDSALLPSC